MLSPKKFLTKKKIWVQKIFQKENWDIPHTFLEQPQNNLEIPMKYPWNTLETDLETPLEYFEHPFITLNILKKEGHGNNTLNLFPPS